MNHHIQAILLLLVLSCPISTKADDAPPAIEQYLDGTREQLETHINGALLKQIEKAREDLKKRGSGHFIYGRILLEEGDDPTLIKSQMVILEGGYFADAVRDLSRPIGFRMHQYAPYNLELNGQNGDVGTIRLKKLPAEKLVTIRGIVRMMGEGKLDETELIVSYRNGPVNTPSGGTEPRRRWPKAIRISVSKSGEFEMAGFSPSEHYCEFEAPGCLTKVLRVNLAEPDAGEFGLIVLERPRIVSMDFIIESDEGFQLENLQTVVLECGDRWKATPDIYGWDLKLVQQKRKVLFDYSYAPCYITDLGKGLLNENLNAVEDGRKTRPDDYEVESGHVYLLNQRFWKRRILLLPTFK